MTDGSLQRIKLQPVFIEKSRLFRRGKNEGNFDIFHSMLAGMTRREREEFGLSGYSSSDLTWLSPWLGTNQRTEEENKTSFTSWKNALVLLGIPLSDIMRVLAAVMLVGNMTYDWPHDHCMGRVAKLLGVGQSCLLAGLWKRTHNIKGTLITRNLDEKEWQLAKTGLAGSLYMRTVYMIIRRVNSHHPAPPPGSSDHDKSVESVLLPAPSSIGILDMFGWQSSMQSPCSLEQLCMNLCSESMQQLYISHTIKHAVEAGRDCSSSYACSDNAASIHLISSLDCGLFKYLDRETSMRGDCQSLINSFHTEHRSNQNMVKIDKNYASCFGIKHYLGTVVYDASQFIGKKPLSHNYR